MTTPTSKSSPRWTSLPKLRRISHYSATSSLQSLTDKEEVSLNGTDTLGCNEELPDDLDKEEEEEGKEGDEEEADCSAPSCKQPVADQISWVQCDQCQEWFHCVCVGLTKEYADNLDSYNCRVCRSVVVPAVGSPRSAPPGKVGVVRGGVKARIVRHQSKARPVPASGASTTTTTGCSAPTSDSASYNTVAGLLQNPMLGGGNSSLMN